MNDQERYRGPGCLRSQPLRYREYFRNDVLRLGAGSFNAVSSQLLSRSGDTALFERNRPWIP